MMRTRIFLVALAGASLGLVGPALAGMDDDRGGGEDAEGRSGATALAQGGGFDALRARTKGTTETEVRERRRAQDDSEDEAEPASEDAAEAADENGIGGPADADASGLSALEVGLTVRTAAGVEIGTIRTVDRSSDGTVQSVIVARADGRGDVRLMPDSLSVSGDVVTTTAELPEL